MIGTPLPITMNTTEDTFDIGLIAAARSGDDNAVSVALSEGANVDTLNKQGYTPAMLAAKWAHGACLSILTKPEPTSRCALNFRVRHDRSCLSVEASTPWGWRSFMTNLSVHS